MSECSDALNVGCSLGESGEDSTNIGTLLHGNDSELVFLIDPDKKGLLVVVEDASAFGPVSVEVAGIEEPIAFFEKEMIVDKLPPHMFRHTFQRIESSCKFTSKTFTSLDNCVHNFVTLLVCDARTKRNPFEISSNSNSS